MVRKRALERWKKLENWKVTPQAVWPNAKSLTIRGGPEAPSAIHVNLGPVFYSIDKSSTITGCFGNQF
jgi:hypothetical protein